MTTTIRKHPKFGTIRGLTFRHERKSLKMFLSGIKSECIDQIKVFTEIPAQCGWCGKDLGTKPGVYSLRVADATSHGICSDCHEAITQEFRSRK